MQEKPALMDVFEGWEGYQASLAHAIAPLTAEQLAWRPAPGMRSVGEIASHISFGRIVWFQRMGAPGSDELAQKGMAPGSEGAIVDDPAELARWLEASWQMVEAALKSWGVADLSKTFLQPYQGKTYAVPRQWAIFRILAHDLHHGGELSVMLGMQGLQLPELGDLGGHVTMPPLAE